MKVLFIVPRAKTFHGDDTTIAQDPHIGIGYLATMLRKYGVETTVVDMRFGYDVDFLLQRIDQFKPDVVGITAYSLGYKEVYEIIQRVKSHGNFIIIIGGPHVSVLRGQVLKETKADFAVKGEGEFTLLELCRKIENQEKDYEKILGLIWRRGEEIIENTSRPYNHNLDDLPFPTYEEVDITKYASYGSRAIQIATSRGCPYGCNFCSVRLVMGRNFRPRSPENVVDEIEYWYRKGFEAYKIIDDCFSTDQKRAEKMCDLIINRGLKIRWSCVQGIRVDQVNLTMLTKMRNSGCGFIGFGVESGNDETLKIIGKHVTVSQVREAFQLTSEVGIKTVAYFIIGHPYETYEKAMETVKLAEEIPSSFVHIQNLIPYPGTELFEWVKEHGTFIHQPEEYLNSSSYLEEEPVFETKEFTAEERRNIMKRCLALHRKTILELRFGSILGYIFYRMTNPKIVEQIFWKFSLGTKLGLFLIKHTNWLTHINARRRAKRYKRNIARAELPKI